MRKVTRSARAMFVTVALAISAVPVAAAPADIDPDVVSYADIMGVSAAEARHRRALEVAAGNLDAKLAKRARHGSAASGSSTNPRFV